jgi:biopolymer transport protein ExbD
MARTFRRPRQSHPIAEMNVTNLIDLGFTLLIIFMIATPLINQEQTIPVTLPSESKSLQPKPDKNTHYVAISIDAKGNTYLDEKPDAGRHGRAAQPPAASTPEANPRHPDPGDAHVPTRRSSPSWTS